VVRVYYVKEITVSDTASIYITKTRLGTTASQQELRAKGTSNYRVMVT